MSGSTNAGDAFDLAVRRRAADSTYAGIVRLVEQAQRSQGADGRGSPTASRSASSWSRWRSPPAPGLLTGDPIRAVAVLVVATPCPLILAVPVALVSGLSRAAQARHPDQRRQGARSPGANPRHRHRQDRHADRRQGQARGDPARRQCSARARCSGSPPRSTRPRSTSSPRRSSPRRGSGASRFPCRPAYRRPPGEGIEGRVDGRHVVVGAPGLVAESARTSRRRCSAATRAPGAIAVAVAVDGRLAGELILADALRRGTGAMLARPPAARGRADRARHRRPRATSPKR